MKPPMNLQSLKNHARLQQALNRGKKNTLILLKSSEPSPRKETTAAAEFDRIETKSQPSNFQEKQTTKNEAKRGAEEVLKHLKQLIGDTALLYCTAAGIHQDDLVDYLDGLRARECVSWMGTQC